MDTSARSELEGMLRRRRADLLREASGREAALRGFSEERESEREEGAQEDEIGRVLARLDDRERLEIAEIEAALDRVADGSYGRCVRCDGSIDVARLAALPAVALCVRCAGALERRRGAAGSAGPPRGAVPSDLELLDDDDIEALLRETVEADERIDHEELRITCRRGVVHLDGVLPSDSQRTMLRRVIEDVMGFDDVVDRLRIDETPWERPERSKAGRAASARADDDVDGAEDDGAVAAPDRPPPDEE